MVMALSTGLQNMKMKRLKLSRWLMLVTAAAMAPLVIVLFYNLYLLHASRERQAHDEVARTGQLIGLELQRVITGLGNVLLTLSSAPVVQNIDLAYCSQFLGRVTARLEGVATLGIIGTDGRIKCRHDSQGLGVSVAGRSYFQDALRSKGVVVGEYTKSMITGKALLPLAVSYRDDKGNIVGVVGTSIDLDWLQELIAKRELPPGASVTIADKNGVILARYPSPEKFIGTQIPQAFRYLVNANAPGTIELTSQDGTRRILAYIAASIDPQGLYVSTGVSVDDTFASIRRATFLSVLASVLTALLALLLSMQISRLAIQKPVKRILAAVNAWRRDDLTARTGLTGKDEFGVIGTAFDTLVTDLAEARQRNDLIMRELDHRVKNVFALIQSVARQTLKGENLSREGLDRFNQRLRGIAQAFSSLKAGDWQRTRLDQVVRAAVEPFNTDEDQKFNIEGPSVEVDARAAMALGMALHELATNAVKYGALSTTDGRIAIQWTVLTTAPPSLRLSWKERSGPVISPPQRSGFGSTMIRRALTAQLGAELNMNFDRLGLECTATMRLAQLSSRSEVEDLMPA